MIGVYIRIMIIGWKVVRSKVVVNKVVVSEEKVLFTSVNVLPCFDYCVENNLSTKMVKAVNRENEDLRSK